MTVDAERMEFAKRLNVMLDEEEFAGLHEGRQTKLAQLTSVSQNSARKWLIGETIPRQDKLRIIASTFGRSAQWLRYGDSEVREEPGAYDIDNSMVLVRSVAGAEKVPFMIDYLTDLGTTPKSCLIVRACGDSMEPTLHDGDSILIDKSKRKLLDGRLFVFRHELGYRVRRVSMNANGSVTLASDNSRYPPEAVSSKDFESLPITGMVIWICGER